jgi:hypothetical protein
MRGEREMNVMAKKKWGYFPSAKSAGPALDPTAKARIEAKVQELIDKELKPKHVKPPPEDDRFNYITDITLKWHGSTLFLVAVYACPGPNAISPTFEARFARMRPAGSDRFDLSFMRHTEKWVELYQGQSLDECLACIRDDPWFIP